MGERGEEGWTKFASRFCTLTAPVGHWQWADCRYELQSIELASEAEKESEGKREIIFKFKQ